MKRLLIAAWLFAALPAAAQGVPEPMRGTWAEPACANPVALLHVTARSAVRLPLDGPARLVRFHTMREQRGWTFGTGAGAEAPRILLRLQDGALRTIEPDAKTRDDRLPDSTPATEWQRCEGPSTAAALLHGEGLAFLGTLERLEAACQAGAPSTCLGVLMQEADVSGDRLLSAAELARLLRGAAWALAAQDSARPEGLATAAGVGGMAALAAARVLVGSLDFDGDGRISERELAQDRLAFPPAGGAAEGRPAALEAMADGLGLLRALLERLAEP